jgi:hypothetical protein
MAELRPTQAQKRLRGSPPETLEKARIRYVANTNVEILVDGEPTGEIDLGFRFEIEGVVS